MGKDTYGLYTDLVVKSIRQRFRWIEPGEFWIGSPEYEEGRDDTEILHKVHLSQGFWLADTACTQALWQAVMGNNPSGFRGDNLPVEKVSWNDTKDFIRKLNSLVKGLELRLPTEAEWECACRSGSKTPFVYGEEGNPTLMNYCSSKLDETVPVGDLFQNAWGLFQMHGNVWEWCEDWYGEYEVFNSGEAVIDPCGPNKGIFRVLRGGSWDEHARLCRSAYRGQRLLPNLYGNDIGFRLASGCEGKKH